jgi:hypothetical protein
VKYANRIAVDPDYARYLVTDSRKFGKVNFGAATDIQVDREDAGPYALALNPKAS